MKPTNKLRWFRAQAIRDSGVWYPPVLQQWWEETRFTFDVETPSTIGEWRNVVTEEENKEA